MPLATPPKRSASNGLLQAVIRLQLFRDKGAQLPLG